MSIGLHEAVCMAVVTGDEEQCDCRAEPRRAVRAADDLASKLSNLSAEARARIAERSEESRSAAQEQREETIRLAAEGFAEKRIEHLEDLLVEEAKKGRTSFVVWNQQIPSNPIQAEAIKRGMDLVVDWLRRRGLLGFALDDGGEQVPDYGYVHVLRLVAHWGDLDAVCPTCRSTTWRSTWCHNEWHTKVGGVPR